MTTCELAGTQVTLWPQAALSVPSRQRLFIADPHFGKPEAFRALQIPVPDGSLAASLERLDTVLRASAAKELVILGDFWHAPTSRTRVVTESLLGWRERWPELKIEVILGNHDRAAGPPPAGFADVVTPSVRGYPPFVATHYPEPQPDGYTLAGHLHPGYKLIGKGRQRLTLPAFWFGATVGVLPAFGAFTGKALIEPAPGERVFVIAGPEVLLVT
jgi:DNA ligase-associated metallophosphoesterase